MATFNALERRWSGSIDDGKDHVVVECRPGIRGGATSRRALVLTFVTLGVASSVTAGCTPKPTLDLRRGADAGLAAVISSVGESVTLTSTDVRLADANAALYARESREAAQRRAALDKHWGAWRGTKVSVPRCQGRAIDVLQEQARCATPCDSDRSCRGGDTCSIAFNLPEGGAIPTELTDLTTVTVCTSPAAIADDVPPNLFGAPRLVSGACAHGYTSLPVPGSLCYRSCDTDIDCPGGASCSKVKSAKVCVAASP